MKLGWQSRTLMVLLVCCLLPLFIFSALSLMPLKPLTIHSIKVNNSPVIAGERIQYTVDYEKFVDKSGVIITRLNNSRIIFYSPVVSNVPTGRHQFQNHLETSPADMPGSYKLVIIIEYEYFGFRKVSTLAESNGFIIIAPPRNKGEKGDRGYRGPRGRVN